MFKYLELGRLGTQSMERQRQRQKDWKFASCEKFILQWTEYFPPPIHMLKYWNPDPTVMLLEHQDSTYNEDMKVEFSRGSSSCQRTQRTCCPVHWGEATARSWSPDPMPWSRPSASKGRKQMSCCCGHTSGGIFVIVPQTRAPWEVLGKICCSLRK